MAGSSITYSALWATPMNQQLGGTSTRRPHTEAYISCVGPTSSLSGGMVLASATTDFTYIESLEVVSYSGSPLYLIYGKPSATGVVTGHKVRFMTTSTGALEGGSTNLSSFNWIMRIVGSGPLDNFT